MIQIIINFLVSRTDIEISKTNSLEYLNCFKSLFCWRQLIVVSKSVDDENNIKYEYSMMFCLLHWARFGIWYDRTNGESELRPIWFYSFISNWNNKSFNWWQRFLARDLLIVVEHRDRYQTLKFCEITNFSFEEWFGGI